MDLFDSLMISRANVLARGSDAGDAYGVSAPAFTTIATGIPCRVSSPKRGLPKEQRAGKKTAENYRLVFMRPWVDGSGNPLNHDNWLYIDTVYYDIFQIIDPGSLHHHLEVWCEEVLV